MAQCRLVTSEVPVKLDRSIHERSSFTCGEESLDRWLKEHSSQAEKRDSARTYVVSDDHQRVLGYYSICAFSVESAEAPPTVRAGAYPIPSVLLARLAVDEREQGTGLGSVLLLHALLVAARVADAIGARMMVVHALHEKAAAFYAANGFKPFEADPLTLYLPMQDIRKTLTLAGAL